MPPNKRKVYGQDIHHQGRVTVHRDTGLPSATEPPPYGQRSRRPDARDVPAASSRYTPPIKHIRFRPTWHKVVGALAVSLGVGIAVTNDVMLFGASTTLLPGGHNELYLVLGIIVAGSSLWWFGWLDREA
jgi:hypothetical protein